MSLRRLAAHNIDYSYRTSDPATYGSVPQSPATWDADAILGCAADLYGYYDGHHNITSYRGSELLSKDCPVGYNSRLLDQVYYNGSGQLASNFSQLREVQRLRCGAVSGSFQMQFRGSVSARLSHNATAAQLQRALSAMPSMGSVEVTYYTTSSQHNESSNSSMALCSATDRRHATVTFLSELGQVPLLSVYRSTLYGNTLSVSRMQAGSQVRVRVRPFRSVLFLSFRALTYILIYILRMDFNACLVVGSGWSAGVRGAGGLRPGDGRVRLLGLPRLLGRTGRAGQPGRLRIQPRLLAAFLFYHHVK